jgi:tetraacyldisaccharide 4'-kinase
LNGLREIKTNEAIVPETYSGKRVAAFCGIGNPDIFYSDLEYFKIEIAWRKSYIDHHSYTADDIREIIDAGKKAGAEAIITTEKDAVKIERLIEDNTPFYAAQIDVEPDDDIKLKSMVLRSIANKQREVRRRTRQTSRPNQSD